MAKAVLALDLGLHTGWAYRLHDAVLSGVWNLKEDKYSGGGMRFVRFSGLLSELHNAQPIGSIYYEGVRAHKGVDAAHAYGGFMATLKAWCETNSVPCEGVPVGEIKKFATGKGNASKDEMVLCAEDWGYKPRDDNEADALCLLHLKTGAPGARGTAIAGEG